VLLHEEIIGAIIEVQGPREEGWAGLKFVKKIEKVRNEGVMTLYSSSNAVYLAWI
jgi:hypothetical protein